MTIQDRAAIVLQQIRAKRALAEKATKGEWISTPEGFRVWCEAGRKLICVTAHNHNERTPSAMANAVFIADARTTCPLALDMLETAIEGTVRRLTMTDYNPEKADCMEILTTLCDQWQKDRIDLWIP